MVAPRNRGHLFVRRPPATSEYTPHKISLTLPKPPAPNNRADHATQLKTALEAAVIEAATRRENNGIPIENRPPALYVEFNGIEGFPLAVEALESVKSRIEVVAVKRISIQKDDGERTFVEKATILVPEGKVGDFLEKFEAYSNPAPKKKGERRHENLIDRVASLRLATFKALWTDDDEFYPSDQDQVMWWELWLRRTDGEELLRLAEFSAQKNVSLASRRLQFPDRIVTLVRGSSRQLSSSIDLLNDIAEIRATTQLAGFFVQLAANEEAEWVDDLVERVTPPQDDSPAVCILDTGVNRGNPLLSNSLSAIDQHACTPQWGPDDHDGHGTEMAGLALYGNLSVLLGSDLQIELTHRLESVKLLPPPAFPPNEPELYGAVTAIATSLPEIAAPDRRRCFSMAVGANSEKDRGRPTSWSAAIDALAAGRSFDAAEQGLRYIEDGGASPNRLFIVAAGNVNPELFHPSHLDACDVTLIDDPGQAWNVLTVGAYTALDQIQNEDFFGWQPMAHHGELSPWSATSVLFETQWPNKPDVVAEGGNVAHQGIGNIETGIPDLQVSTTYFEPQTRVLTLAWATSAACAQVANVAGQIMAKYPELWPETVRGLIVHSAEWTPAMRSHLAGGQATAKTLLVRRYGFGVPSLSRALFSAADNLTLIVQGSIEPYEKGAMKDIQFYQLPWPKAELAQLAEEGVKLRVTLSYFIEPNPSRRGWRRKHRYQSHGLRFKVIGPAESVEAFKKRLNSEELGDSETKPESPEDSHWFLGPRIRERGSIHSDVWTGSAIELSERSVIAVYPVGGWWKDQPKQDRSSLGARYSLVVSIESSAENIDIWTPVAQEIEVENDVVVEVAVE